MNSLLETVHTLESRPFYSPETLEDRKRDELEFFNANHALTKPSNSHFYVLADAPGGAFDYVRSWVRKQVAGRVFLDYACGNGFYALLAARAGAEVSVGIDISDTCVRNARNAASKESLRNARFLQADCEATGLPDNSFDLVMCSGMLHHLDLDKAIPELRRILKPGGRVIAVEALGYNPAIRLFRAMTPHLRTKWEAKHIIELKHLREIRKHLDVKNIRYFHLADLFCIPLINRPGFAAARALASTADRLVTRIPGIQLMSWMITFELRKQDAAV